MPLVDSHKGETRSCKCVSINDTMSITPTAAKITGGQGAGAAAAESDVELIFPERVLTAGRHSTIEGTEVTRKDWKVSLEMLTSWGAGELGLEDGGSWLSGKDVQFKLNAESNKKLS